MKIIQVADGAFFVSSYSEQTIMRAYTTDATIQSFGFDERPDEYGSKKEIDTPEHEMKVDHPVRPPRV